MVSELIQQREALAARHEQLVERWPDRSGASFRAELTEVAEALERLATRGDWSGTDPVELAKTWKYAGMAWFELAANRESELLVRACGAYRRAEQQLQRSADQVEPVTVDYCLGRALLNLADRDRSVLVEATTRLERATRAARRVAPQLLPRVDDALRNAQQVSALLHQVGTLDMRISGRRAETGAGSDPSFTQQDDVDPASLLPLLQQQFDQAKASMTDVRRETLHQIMAELGEMVERSGTGRSLTELNQDRLRMDNLMARMRLLLQEQRP
jgi:hypothetical protein